MSSRGVGSRTGKEQRTGRDDARIRSKNRPGYRQVGRCHDGSVTNEDGSFDRVDVGG